MSALGRLLEELDETDLARLAERLAPYLDPPEPADQWLDSKAAAEHLGISLPTLRRMVASGKLVPVQGCRGGRLRFRRSMLDSAG